MGFEIQDRTLLVRFEGQYEGLEVELRLNVPLGTYFDIASAAEGEKVESAMGRFAEACLVSWNMERHGEPVPATVEGFRSVVPPDLARILIEKWVEVAQEPDTPLAGSSLQNGARAATSPTP